MSTLGRVLRVLLMNALFCEASFDQEHLICKCLDGATGNSYSLPRLRQQQIRQSHPPFPPSSLPPVY